MKAIGMLLVASSMLIAQAVGQTTSYSIKCGNDVYICSDNGLLSAGNVCHTTGGSNYIPLVIGDCIAMINAVLGELPFAGRCPNGNTINQYIVYDGNDLPVGELYEPGKPTSSTCTCPAGTCGPSTGGGGGTVGGDPHFRTHDGTLYSYHGECDLVMARSSSFGNGLGLDVHARTTIIGGTWSLVSHAAVRIGSDIFELQNDGTYYINGESNIPLVSATTLASNYTIEYTEEVVPDGEDSIRSWYRINLNNDGEKIEITNYKKMLSINVNAKLSDTVGMLGSSTKPGLVGRDGRTTIIDANEMGTQWQVRMNEPMLFTTIRAPQYPEQCILPIDPSKQSRRRLRPLDNNTMNERAQKACRNVAQKLYSFCIQDVIMSGDVSLAHAYVGGVF